MSNLPSRHGYYSCVVRVAAPSFCEPWSLGSPKRLHLFIPHTRLASATDGLPLHRPYRRRRRRPLRDGSAKTWQNALAWAAPPRLPARRPIYIPTARCFGDSHGTQSSSSFRRQVTTPTKCECLRVLDLMEEHMVAPTWIRWIASRGFRFAICPVESLCDAILVARSTRPFYTTYSTKPAANS